MSEQLAEQVEEKVETPVDGEVKEGQEEVKQEMTDEQKAQGKRRLSKRNKTLTYQNREKDRILAEKDAEIARLKEATQLKSEPDPDNYADEDKLRADQERWKAQESEKLIQQGAKKERERIQKEKQQEQYQEQVGDYMDSRQKAVESNDKYAEWEKEVDRVANNGAQAVREVILSSRGLATDIVSYFGKNPDELEDISVMSPQDQYIKMGEIKATLKAETKVKKNSSAPDPTRSEKGSAQKSRATTSAYDPKRETFAEYATRRNSRRR